MALLVARGTLVFLVYASRGRARRGFFDCRISAGHGGATTTIFGRLLLVKSSIPLDSTDVCLLREKRERELRENKRVLPRC